MAMALMQLADSCRNAVFYSFERLDVLRDRCGAGEQHSQPAWPSVLMRKIAAVSATTSRPFYPQPPHQVKPYLPGATLHSGKNQGGASLLEHA